MPCYIVTESDYAAELLKVILQEDVLAGGVRVVGSGGHSMAISTASSILASRAEPVALLVNAETTFPPRVREEIDYLEQMLKAGSPGVKRRVIVAVPELEVILFQDQQFVESLFDTELANPELMLIDAANRPSHWVRTLLSESSELLPSLLERKNDHRLKLRDTPLISQLRQFIDECRKKAA